MMVTPSLAEGLDAPGWSWSGSPTAFHTQAAVTHDGVDAVQAQLICDPSGQSSTSTSLQTWVGGPGLLWSFLKLDAHPGGGWLELSVDGQVVARYVGKWDWMPVSQPLDAGFHEVAWSVGHSAGPCPGDEFAWIDEVLFEPGGASPQSPG